MDAEVTAELSTKDKKSPNTCIKKKDKGNKHPILQTTKQCP